MTVGAGWQPDRASRRNAASTALIPQVPLIAIGNLLGGMADALKFAVQVVGELHQPRQVLVEPVHEGTVVAMVPKRVAAARTWTTSRISS